MTITKVSDALYKITQTPKWERICHPSIVTEDDIIKWIESHPSCVEEIGKDYKFYSLAIKIENDRKVTFIDSATVPHFADGELHKIDSNYMIKFNMKWYIMTNDYVHDYVHVAYEFLQLINIITTWIYYLEKWKRIISVSDAIEHDFNKNIGKAMSSFCMLDDTIRNKIIEFYRYKKNIDENMHTFAALVYSAYIEAGISKPLDGDIGKTIRVISNWPMSTFWTIFKELFRAGVFHAATIIFENDYKEILSFHEQVSTKSLTEISSLIDSVYEEI